MKLRRNGLREFWRLSFNMTNFVTDVPFFDLQGMVRAAKAHKKLGGRFVGITGHFGKSYFYPEITLFCTYLSGTLGNIKRFGSDLPTNS